MPPAPPSRVSVLRDNHLVPLMPGAPARGSMSSSPWKGLVVERHAVDTLEIPEHDHHSFCLHLQLSGAPEMEWWCEGRNGLEAPAAGDLILLAPGTRDRLRWQGPSERLILSVEPALIATIAGEMQEAAPVSAEFPNRWALRDDALRLLLTEMGREASTDYALGGLYGDLLGLSLARTLLGRFAAVPVAPPELRGGLPLPKLRHTLAYITDQLDQDLRLEQIAGVAGLSPFHFARLFRQSTGQTPHGYLLDQRLRRAQQMLRGTTRPIAEIAADCGFPTPAHFARVFRRQTGLTPGTWRRSA